MGISSALGSSALLPAGLGFRNKIINGDMRVAQRGTAAVTGSGSEQYTVDRWGVVNSVGTVTFQQSSVAPSGFTKSLLATVTATGSYGTSGFTTIFQKIEGFNVVDLAYGTSSAKQITVSFWVRSSVTGSYSASFGNNAFNRTLYRNFSVLAANTWEYKTFSIFGDTSGTWTTDNTTGLSLSIQLGRGTSTDGPENTWASGVFVSNAANVDFAANAGATFYITGVQLEQNYEPTPFEQRPYGVELALCQRYYEKSYDVDTAPNTNTNNGLYFFSSSTDVNGQVFVPIQFKVEKRSPNYNVSFNLNTGALLGSWAAARNGANVNVAMSANYKGTKGFNATTGNIGVGWVVAQAFGHWFASDEL